MQVTETGSKLSEGGRPLERLWTVRVSSDKVDRELDRMLLNEARRVKVPGFRTQSKAVPPVFRRTHAPRLLEILLYRLVKPGLESRLSSDKLAALPNLAIRSHQRIGDEIEVTCEFEVRPEIPAPQLEGKTLLVPKPVFPPDHLDTIVERIRRQNAKWLDVARPAGLGDRLLLNIPGADKPQAIELRSELPKEMQASLLGAAAGGQVRLQLQQGQAEPTLCAVAAVQQAQLPAVDLAFARRFMPEAGSVDVFRERLGEQVKRHSQAMVDHVCSVRVLHLLDEATGEFELPAKAVEHEVQQQRKTIVEQVRKRGRTIALEDVPEDQVGEVVKRKVRNGLIFEEYVLREQLKVSAEQVDEEIAAAAADEPDPAEFRKRVLGSQESVAMLYERLLRKQIVQTVLAKVAVQDDEMSLEQLDRIYRGADPTLESVEVPAAATREGAND